MRVSRIYQDQPLSVSADVVLSDDAAHYIARVLRASIGDAVTLFNGDGRDYHGVIGEISKRRVVVALKSEQARSTEAPIRTVLGLAISKGDRFDYAVQKATELGVTEIAPLISERVDVKLPADRMAKKLGHWQAIAISACEQCERATVPLVHPPIALEQWVANNDCTLKWVLHHEVDGSLSGDAPESIALLIGPEGGLSQAELALAQHNGFLPLNLGPRILRTETAPIVALTALGLRWGDLR
jgi:16S rRNA (uracil1498-N3)-methyltransferase